MKIRKDVTTMPLKTTVTFLKKPEVSFVSLVKHGANNTPFRVIKSNKGEMMNKVVQAIRVLKNSKADLKTLVGKEFRDDSIEEDGNYLIYEQVDKSVCDPDTKSVVVLDPDNHVYAITYELCVEKSAIPFSTHGKVETSTASWDASKARSQFKKYASDDEGEINFSLYKKGFALIDGEADNLGSYKLPHHYVDSDGNITSVWKGVTAAMGAIHGARTGGMEASEEDLKGAYNHLVKEYALFDQEPPDFKSLIEGTINKSVVEEQKLPEGYPEAVVLKKDIKEIDYWDVWDEMYAMTGIVSGIISQSARTAEDRKESVLVAIDNFRFFCETIFSEMKSVSPLPVEKRLGGGTSKLLEIAQKHVSIKKEKEGGNMFELESKDELVKIVTDVVVTAIQAKADEDAKSTEAKTKADADAKTAEDKQKEVDTLKESVKTLSETVEKLSGTVVTNTNDVEAEATELKKGESVYTGMFGGLRSTPGGISGVA